MCSLSIIFTILSSSISCCSFFWSLSCFHLILKSVLDTFLMSSLELSLLLSPKYPSFYEDETVNISSFSLSFFSDFTCTILISFALGVPLWRFIESFLVGAVCDVLELNNLVLSSSDLSALYSVEESTASGGKDLLHVHFLSSFNCLLVFIIFHAELLSLF